MDVHCVCPLLCLFSGLSHRVDPLEMSIIIIVIIISIVDDERH